MRTTSGTAINLLMRGGRALAVGIAASCVLVVGATASAGSAGTGTTQPLDRQIAISPSRTMHIECRGHGGPTVVLIAGGVNSGAIWSMPYDFAHPTPTVFGQVATFTRVCAYDRPNTASPAPNDRIALGTSTPTTGTVTPANGVIDLHRMLRAAHVRGPYVLVGHSFGGLIARLYSSTYPNDVAGLVLIDSPSELFFDRLTVAQQEMWIAASSGRAAFPGAESFNFPATFAEIRAAAEAAPRADSSVHQRRSVRLPPRRRGRHPRTRVHRVRTAIVPRPRRRPTRARETAPRRTRARHPLRSLHLRPASQARDLGDPPNRAPGGQAMRSLRIFATVLLTAGAVASVAPSSTAAATMTGGDFSGLVKIAPGRSIFVECRGHGSPTVVLISGQGNSGHEWHQILDPADPAHAEPLDQVSAGQGDMHDSRRAVLPQAARTTRVCTYDRPDTRTTGAHRSTPRSQPHSVRADVDDLHRVLHAIDAARPYVLVAHSYGGFIAELYARTYPADVGGLVMVDAVSSYISQAATAAKLQVWDQQHRTTSAALPEGVEVLDAIAAIDAAPPPEQIPTVVLSADKPYPQLPPGSGDPDASVTFADWSSAQQLLATGLGAEHITDTNSGHHIYLYSPSLVVSAIRKIVTEVRVPPTHLTPVVQQVLAPPRWYRGDDGRFHVQYELQLTNTVPLPVTLTDIDVRDGHGHTLTRLYGQRLTDAVTLLGNDTVPTTQLPASSVAVAWLDLTFTHQDRIPAELEHRVTIDVGPGLPVGPIITATGPATRTVQSTPPTIGAPLRGGRWVAVVGPHRRAPSGERIAPPRSALRHRLLRPARRRRAHPHRRPGSQRQLPELRPARRGGRRRDRRRGPRRTARPDPQPQGPGTARGGRRQPRHPPTATRRVRRLRAPPARHGPSEGRPTRARR